jgi:MoaA/NifB/PqqE/SkfB family radical SAM enzyme
MNPKLVQATINLPITPTEHFCIAPFQSIRQNPQGQNSPCAFGAGEWDHSKLTPIERWHSDELNQLREEFISGRKPDACHRCWAEEDAGKKSLRQRQFEYFPNDYLKFIKSGLWLHGPKTAVFKTSNICNLACRSCGGWDSNTFAKEGQYYIKEYNTKTVKSTTGEIILHNRFVPKHSAAHIDFMNYVHIADNLEKIDFFGGEPFLNTSQIELLEYLAERGLSKNITLFYSTNCTNHPTERLKQVWNKFKRVEISVSIDGIGDHFEYLRWPGKWKEAKTVLTNILNLKKTLSCEVYVMAGLTFSLLNMYYADSIYHWLKEEVGNVYVNMVNSPDYLALHIVPESVKYVIRGYVSHPEILGYIDIKDHNPLSWKQFIIWTKRQDLYRKQSFESTFPEFFKLIKNDWDLVTDLSEKNFYQPC